MKRYAMQDLYAWKENPSRKPLLIEGARQVGKTWLMKEFGRQAFSNTVYLDFTKSKQLGVLFSGDISPKVLLPELELLTKQRIDPKTTLVIFDEIQEIPRALTSLKYFNELAPEYHLICAGSLMGVALHQGTSFPVGQVNLYRLNPLTFQEFLIAVGEERFVQPMQNLEILSMKVFASELINLLKRYLLIGGMPEAVDTYSKEQSFEAVRKVQKEILAAYDRDISKRAPTNEVPRIRAILDSAPRQLAKENKKFVYGHIKRGARGRDYELGIMWLCDTGVLHRINNLARAEYPLKVFEDTSAFKLYLHDVGLLSYQSGLDDRILFDENTLFDSVKGALTEQYVMQELFALRDFPLYYWTNSSGTAEVDFVTQASGKTGVVPIEVKSGINLRAKSLKVFQDKYQPSLAIRFSLADYKINPIPDSNNAVVDMPLYAVSCLPRLLEQLSLSDL